MMSRHTAIAMLKPHQEGHCALTNEVATRLNLKYTIVSKSDNENHTWKQRGLDGVQLVDEVGADLTFHAKNSSPCSTPSAAASRLYGFRNIHRQLCAALERIDAATVARDQD